MQDRVPGLETALDDWKQVVGGGGNPTEIDKQRALRGINAALKTRQLTVEDLPGTHNDLPDSEK
jgi:transcriptional regulator NrdR family protein